MVPHVVINPKPPTPIRVLPHPKHLILIHYIDWGSQRWSYSLWCWHSARDV